MTQLGLDWLKFNETKRSNLATEAEAKRSNLARETETVRSNLAKEAETYRSNLADEGIKSETNRINEKFNDARVDQAVKDWELNSTKAENDHMAKLLKEIDPQNSAKMAQIYKALGMPEWQAQNQAKDVRQNDTLIRTLLPKTIKIGPVTITNDM